MMQRQLLEAMDSWRKACSDWTYAAAACLEATAETYPFVTYTEGPAEDVQIKTQLEWQAYLMDGPADAAKAPRKRVLKLKVVPSDRPQRDTCPCLKCTKLRALMPKAQDVSRQQRGVRGGAPPAPAGAAASRSLRDAAAAGTAPGPCPGVNRRTGDGGR